MRTLEKSLKKALISSASAVTKFSGGLNAASILGRADLVARLSKHPLARALRFGKLTLAALDHTLMAYHADNNLEIPVWAMMHATIASLEERAIQLKREPLNPGGGLHGRPMHRSHRRR